METSNSAFPPMDKISLVGIWIETLLYGINCVMYGLCMFNHLPGRFGRKTPPVRGTLLLISTILFLLSTIHVGASLRQLLEAFVYAPANVPSYSTTYWLNLTTTPRLLKGNVYCTLVLAQDVILIWRLYVVFTYNWRVIVLPIILAAGCVGCAYAASAVSVSPNTGLFSPLLTSLIISAWVFGFALNASVTGSIVLRLWWIGRKMAAMTATSTNRFTSSIYMVVESGAISAVTNAAVLGLFASTSPAALSSMDVAAQVTVLTPLLIVVQVAHNHPDISKGDLSKTVPGAQDTITFRVRVSRDSGQDLLPSHTPQSRSPCSADGVAA